MIATGPQHRICFVGTASFLLGADRLAMLFADTDSIEQVVAFTPEGL